MLERAVQTDPTFCATLQRSRNKRNDGSFWLKSLTSFKLCTTTPNNLQQGGQTDTTCNIQHCCASVCTGLTEYQILWTKNHRLHVVINYSENQTQKTTYHISNTTLKSYGLRAFSVAAPILWKALLDSVRDQFSSPSFKKELSYLK